MLKFGKLPPKYHCGTLVLSKYRIAGALPAPPLSRAWQNAVADWGMLGNDTVGNCVIAATLHYIMAATANTKKPVTFTTEQAIALYTAVTGYDPSQTDANGNNPTDNGTAWTDMLAYWQTKGVYGHFIKGWASIDYTDIETLRDGVNIFGGVLVGTAVTNSMEQQFDNNQSWSSPFSGGTVGLHGIPMLGYDPATEDVITWGKDQPCDPTFPTEFDESYVVITDDFLNGDVAPNALNLSALTTDLAIVAAGGKAS